MRVSFFQNSVEILLSNGLLHTSIVEFASQEDSQRAIRELSEQFLLGRPVFIREVSPYSYLKLSNFNQLLSGP